ncbi:unnamed protein product [Aspergillus oryzae var. brunneus]|uniref:Unnamed protein product n=2 Tax=Aspergillus oryzae TaxID=5062 RepID=A0AAN4YZ59_ASPOZ|nr:unnamed protein product [Aspergillus oryzae]GMG38837.1 unnamed protein product [Aspergillus oryzae]GMG53144.1 unnamed protein product [Aspergillus oryzae var. brunneus]
MFLSGVGFNADHEDALREEPVEKGGEGQRGDGAAVGEGEEVAAGLGDFGGTGDTQALAVVGVSAPFRCKGHGGEDGVEGEIDHREEELGRVGDEHVGYERCHPSGPCD